MHRRVARKCELERALDYVYRNAIETKDCAVPNRLCATLAFCARLFSVAMLRRRLTCKVYTFAVVWFWFHSRRLHGETELAPSAVRLAYSERGVLDSGQMKQMTKTRFDSCCCCCFAWTGPAQGRVKIPATRSSDSCAAMQQIHM